jgi:hypothetical protein
MGADANTKQIVCSKTAEILESSKNPIKTHLIDTEDSTIPIDKAIELINKCSSLNSHEEELKVCKDVGSKIPILASEIGTDPDYKFTIVWFNFIGFIVLHIIGLSGAVVGFFGPWFGVSSGWTGVYCEFFS